jgi:hypothetical protein
MHIYIEDEPNFTPTWLYIKQHNKTKLKYFGKTINDPRSYKGSGTRWTHHLNKHGVDIETVWCHLFQDKENLVAFATHFSEMNNICKSNEWANIKPENGLDGGTTDEIIQQSLASRKKRSPQQEKQQIEKQLATKLARYGTFDFSTTESIKRSHKTKLSKYGTLNSNTSETIKKSRITKEKNNALNPHRIFVVCEICKQSVSTQSYGRYHGEKCTSKSETDFSISNNNNPSKYVSDNQKLAMKIYRENSCWIYNPTIHTEKSILKIDAQSFLINGWVLGRKKMLRNSGGQIIGIS